LTSTNVEVVLWVPGTSQGGRQSRIGPGVVTLFRMNDGRVMAFARS
jgi:hypothetical protein